MYRRVWVIEPEWKLPAYDWGHERELCKRCEHYRERMGGGRNADRNVVMSCALNHQHTAGRNHHGTCIDMRYDGECGREGWLFKEKVK